MNKLKISKLITYTVKFRDGLELFYEWDDEATCKEIKENIEKYKEFL